MAQFTFANFLPFEYKLPSKHYTYLIWRVLYTGDIFYDAVKVLNDIPGEFIDKTRIRKKKKLELDNTILKAQSK